MLYYDGSPEDEVVHGQQATAKQQRLLFLLKAMIHQTKACFEFTQLRFLHERFYSSLSVEGTGQGEGCVGLVLCSTILSTNSLKFLYVFSHRLIRR